MTPNEGAQQRPDGELASKECLAELLRSGLFSDAEVKVDGKIIKVHKAVITAKSQWFQARFQHINTLKMTLNSAMSSSPEQRYDAVKAVIEFIYTGDYSSEGGMAVDLLTNYLAKELAVEGLAELSSKKYADNVLAYFRNATAAKTAALLKIMIRPENSPTGVAPIVQAEALKGFRTLIDKLDIMNNPQEALSILETIFSTSEEPIVKFEDSYSPTSKKDNKNSHVFLYTWKCNNCRTKFQYHKKPKKGDIRLPVCPCCDDIDKWTLGRSSRKCKGEARRRYEQKLRAVASFGTEKMTGVKK